MDRRVRQAINDGVRLVPANREKVRPAAESTLIHLVKTASSKGNCSFSLPSSKVETLLQQFDNTYSSLLGNLPLVLEIWRSMGVKVIERTDKNSSPDNRLITVSWEFENN